MSTKHLAHATHNVHTPHTPCAPCLRSGRPCGTHPPAGAGRDDDQSPRSPEPERPACSPETAAAVALGGAGLFVGGVLGILLGCGTIGVLVWAAAVAGLWAALWAAGD